MKIEDQVFEKVEQLFKAANETNLDFSEKKLEFNQNLSEAKINLESYMNVNLNNKWTATLRVSCGVGFVTDSDTGKAYIQFFLSEHCVGDRIPELYSGNQVLRDYYGDLLKYLNNNFPKMAGTDKALETRNEWAEKGDQTAGLDAEYGFIVYEFDAPAHCNRVSKVEQFKREKERGVEVLPLLRGSKKQIAWGTSLMHKAVDMASNQQIWEILSRGWTAEGLKASFWIDHDELVTYVKKTSAYHDIWNTPKFNRKDIDKLIDSVLRKK